MYTLTNLTDGHVKVKENGVETTAITQCCDGHMAVVRDKIADTDRYVEVAKQSSSGSVRRGHLVHGVMSVQADE